MLIWVAENSQALAREWRSQSSQQMESSKISLNMAEPICSLCPSYNTVSLRGKQIKHLKRKKCMQNLWLKLYRQFFQLATADSYAFWPTRRVFSRCLWIKPKFCDRLSLLCYPAKFWLWNISIVLLSAITDSHTGKSAPLSITANIQVGSRAQTEKKAFCKASLKEGSLFLMDTWAESSSRQCTECCIFNTAEVMWRRCLFSC